MNQNKAYQIRRSARAKRARIIVTSETIEVVAPFGMPEKQIHKFVAAKQAWVESAQNKVQLHVDSISKFSPEQYKEGSLIPYQGKQYQLSVKSSQGQALSISFEKKFIAHVPEGVLKTLSTKGLSEQLRHALISWMMSAAADKSIEYIHKYAPLCQLYPRSIKIKALKSRWGSCGIHDDVNLNWLLILAPVEVFEYVVVHELCHIQERNHSAAFWRLVDRYCPDYKQNRDWLKQHGSSLMLGL